MGWLNPFALWFLAGGSIPVIIHLLHRQKYKKIRWAAMEWLLAAIRKTRRRLQLENLILLLIRILIMILLAFALARPYLSGAATNLMGESDTHYIFVIDNSYSMEWKKEDGQNSSFDKAKQACRDLMKTIQPTPKDRFTLMTLSEYPEIRKQEWNDLKQVEQALDDVKVSQYGSNMITGFQELQKLLDRNLADAPKNADRRVYLFTDLQRVGWDFPEEANVRKLQELTKTLSHMEGTWFYLIDLGDAEATNVAIVDVQMTKNILTVKRPADVKAELFSFSPKAVTRRVQLLVDGALTDTQTVAIEPNQLKTVVFQHQWRGDSDIGPHAIEVRFDPQDKQYDYPSVDNHRHLAVEVKEAIRALLIDGEPKDGKRLNRETGTLEIALSTAEIFKCTWVTPHNFYEQKLEDFDVVALCNVKSLQPDVLRKLEEFVERGGGLFVSLGSQIDAVWYNREMAACNGRILEDGGCQKCGRAKVRDEEITKEKRSTSGGGGVEEVRVHSGGLGLLPGRIGELVGTPPDLAQSGVPRRPSWVRLNHKIFSAFENVKKASPYSLVFWKFFKIEGYDPAGKLAEFDDPAKSILMIEQSWHEGRVVFLTTAIDGEPDWNQMWPGRPPYIPIVTSMGEYLAARTSTRRNFFVGEPLEYFVPYDTNKDFLLYPPGEVYRCPKDGADRTSPGPCPRCQMVLDKSHLRSGIEVKAEKREEDRFMRLFYAPDLSLTSGTGQGARQGLQARGIYSLTRADASLDARPVTYFGVNVGPRQPEPALIRGSESNPETISRDELKKRLPEFKVEFLGEKSESGDEVKFKMPEAELWRKVLYFLLGFLLIESVLACIFGRSKQ